MRLIRGIHNISPQDRPCVATIGNFDGVHLGHQQLLLALKTRAKALGVPATVIIFEPHPKEYFDSSAQITRLTNLREKLHYIAQFKIDSVLCLPFNNTLAKLTATAFIEKILLCKLGVKQIFAGCDFRFGYQRQGDIELLREYGQKKGFLISDVPNVESEDGARISSTLVREALGQGELGWVKHYLGRDYGIQGRVVVGDRRGREIGFPTANIHLKRRAAALTGVFAVKVYGLDKQGKIGVANIGTRPTVGGSQQRLEVHLFDFDETIYGQHVQVDMLHKLREEQRFASFELLQQQIQRDCQQAKAFFAALEQ